jgi:hypothetical protein
MKGFISHGRSGSDLKAHLVLTTKYRRQVFTDAKKMKNTKRVKIVALDIGPDYWNQIRDGLVAKGVSCEVTTVEPICLLDTSPIAEINMLRQALRKEKEEVSVFLPFTTELFLEEPDFIIMFSGYRSMYEPDRLKIIPCVWPLPTNVSDLKGIKWTNKPELSVGFLGASYESRKIVKLAAYLPKFLKQQLLQGRHLKYVYTSHQKKLPILLARMPSFVRTEVLTKLKATTLKTDVTLHSYTRTSEEKKNYQNHMLRNTYIFCPRGFENFSYRFYEALAYGRIPVLIDTDTVLPPNVNWDELCVRVPYEKISELEKIIRIDYETKTERDFIERQEKALKVIEDLKKMSWLEDIIEEIAKAAQHR